MFMEDPPEFLRYPQNRGNDGVGEDITKTTQRMGLWLWKIYVIVEAPDQI